MRWICCLMPLVFATSCTEPSSDDKPIQQKEPPAAQDESSTPARNSKQAPAPTAITPIPSTGDLCQDIQVDTLSKIMGTAMEFKRKTTPAPKRLFCHYYATSVGSKVRAAVLVDCNGEAANVEHQQQMMKRKAKKNFVLVSDIGRGGAKGFQEAGNTNLLAFVHDRFACMVQLSTNHLDKDVVHPLGLLAYGLLSDSNRPN